MTSKTLKMKATSNNQNKDNLKNIKNEDDLQKKEDDLKKK